MKLYALLAFRNEKRFLPNYFRNVAPQVDGIIALDDRSDDGSAEFVQHHPALKKMIRISKEDDEPWSSYRNHELLCQAALEEDADMVVGLDADERIERRFRERMDEEMVRIKHFRHFTYSVRLLELWNSPRTWRKDGIWGTKRRVRLFNPKRRNVPDHNRFHGQWAEGMKVEVDLIIYHLRMIQEQDRIFRKEKWNQLDPDKKWQPMGYDYMTDETGIELERIPEGREFEPLDFV